MVATAIEEIECVPIHRSAEEERYRLFQRGVPQNHIPSILSPEETFPGLTETQPAITTPPLVVVIGTPPVA